VNSAPDRQLPTLPSQAAPSARRRDGVAKPVSASRRTVAGVDPDQHRRAWLARWGDAYATDAEREAAYAEALRTLAELQAVFGASAAANAR